MSVTAGSGCAWTASTTPGSWDWLGISSALNGKGNGAVNWFALGNSNTSQRTGTLTIASQTFTVTQSGATPVVLPDLTISASVANTYTSGQTKVETPVTVVRSGGSLTSGTYVLARLYWSTNSAWDSGDTVLWESNGSTPDYPVSYLNSNGSKTVTPQVTIPSVPTGTFYIIAYVDPPINSYPSGFHSESNDNNNIAVYTVLIQQVVQTGTLSVTTTPVSGAIYVDDSYKDTGSWSGSISVGSHKVSFGDVAGYTTPPFQTTTVSANQITYITGTYIQIQKPNLTPYQPSGWSDKIVVSNATGCTANSCAEKNSFFSTDMLYVNWAVTNIGSLPTSATFYTQLYVDGIAIEQWYTNPP